MAVRLSGAFDSEGLTPIADGGDARWEQRYPVALPWRRQVHRRPDLFVAVDICGDSSFEGAFHATDGGRLGVAGAIRLDDADELRRSLDVHSLVEGAALVLAAYRRWGSDAFSRLDGEFALVLWDLPAQTLYLVRDPFGARRLHYAGVGTVLYFSTEVEGVLAWPASSRTPDDVTILDFLLARYSTEQRTFFHWVKRVPRRHLVRVSRSDRRVVETRGVFRIDRPFSSLEEGATAFRSALERSVAERLLGRGVVCHVSGGLDSASIAALAVSRMTNAGSPRVGLAAARFPGLPCDEGAPICELGRSLGTRVHEWSGLEPETSDLTAPRLAWPLGRQSIAGSRQGDLDLAIQLQAGVMLSGFGGNQMAIEEGFFRDALRSRGWRGYLAGVARIAKGRTWRAGRRHFRRTLMLARHVARSALFGSGRTSRRAADIPVWFRPALHRAWGVLRDESDSHETAQPQTGSWMSDAVWTAATGDASDVWCLEHMDARAAERGIEFRHPYLSWGLMRMAMSVPWHLRAPSSVDRRLQRLALQGVLPERLRWRDTFANFNDAYAANVIAPQSEIEKILGGPRWVAGDFVDRAGAMTEFQRLRANRAAGAAVAGDAQAWQAVRDVAALEAWLREL